MTPGDVMSAVMGLIWLSIADYASERSTVVVSRLCVVLAATHLLCGFWGVL